MSPTTWLILAALIAANALYVAAEFSAVGVRRSMLQEKAAAGDVKVRRLLDVVEDTGRLDRHIAACQVGITFSSLLLGAFGQWAITPDLWPVLARSSGLSTAAAVSVAATGVLLGLTLLQVLLGELVPKSLALQFPLRTALVTLRPVHWSARLLTPFIWLLNGSAMALLRLLRLPPGTHRHVHDPEEIEMLVGESRKGGLLAPAEHRRMVAALRLRDLPARALMVPLQQVVSVPADATMEEAAGRIAHAPFTRIPVYQRDPADLVAFLHAKDVFLHGPQQAHVRDVMRPVPRVLAATPGDRLLTILREERAHLAVVEQAGSAVGLVTLEDVLAEMLRGQASPGRLTQDSGKAEGAGA